MCAHREDGHPAGSWACEARLNGGCECSQGRCEVLRESEQAQDRCVLLPLFPQMTLEEQDRVVEALRAALPGCIEPDRRHGMV
jgi:perosamine synthetase